MTCARLYALQHVAHAHVAVVVRLEAVSSTQIELLRPQISCLLADDRPTRAILGSPEALRANTKQKATMHRSWTNLGANFVKTMTKTHTGSMETVTMFHQQAPNVCQARRSHVCVLLRRNHAPEKRTQRLVRKVPVGVAAADHD
jgi:deoxyribose-phosphate aldolase